LKGWRLVERWGEEPGGSGAEGTAEEAGLGRHESLHMPLWCWWVLNILRDMKCWRLEIKGIGADGKERWSPCFDLGNNKLI